jgi:kumamolisin
MPSHKKIPFFKRRILGDRAAGTTYTALEVATAYSFPAGTGKGQGIGLIELGGGYEQSDMVTYFGGLELAVPIITAVSVDEATNSPTGDPDGPDGEVALDIQIAGAIAPQAIIKVFFAPNTNQGFLDAVNMALADPQITILSISWGGPENSWGGTPILKQFDAAFAGSTKLVFVASGDSGSSDGESGKNVDFPGSSPNVIACGGTSLTSTTEVVWNSNGGSSGGGVSSVFAMPAYQALASVPGGLNRGVPDISGNADPDTGYEVVVDGSPEVYGGTSCVAPLMAGLFARIASKLTSAQIRALLYQVGLPAGSETAFREITSGNNGVYVAAAGWNACCGLGSPKGSVLATDINTPPPPTTVPPPVVKPPPVTPPPVVPPPTTKTYLPWLQSLAAWIAENPATLE